MNRENLSGREQFFLEQLHTESRQRGLEAMDAEMIQELLSDLEREDREVLDRYPAELMSARIISKADDLPGETGGNQESTRTPERKQGREGEEARIGREPSPKGASRFLLFAKKAQLLPLAAAALFAIIAGVQLFSPSVGGELPPGLERIKGMEPALRVYRAERGEAALLNEGSFAREFDLLQLEYNGAGAPYGTIISIDGRGTVTLHYPDKVDESPQLESGSVLLPYAYQLDSAPEFERFFFVTSREAFSPDTILSAARDLAAKKPENIKTGELDLPRRFDLTSFTILKEEIK